MKVLSLTLIGLLLAPWTEGGEQQTSVPQITPLECGSLYISVNSLRYLEKFRSQRIRKFMSDNMDDKIEMNWNFSGCKDENSDIIPDSIALFTSDPEINNNSIPVEVIKPSNYKWNYHVTSTSLNMVLPGGWNRKHLYPNTIVKGSSGEFCLPYWIASYKNGKLIKKNCMKIFPTWMEDTKESIADLPLSSLIIPGTHDAGAFAFQFRIQQETILDKFTLCQDRDIWTQLVSGVRYLDFRIGYYDGTKSLFARNTANAHKLWLNHNFVKITPLVPLLEDIKLFLDSTTTEIVILDIHQLPVGFYTTDEIIRDRHYELLKVLKEIFADHINSFTEAVFRSYSKAGPTVADILKTGRRLIIGYPERTIYNENKWLWPSVRHMWANTNDPNNLKTYLDNVMENPPIANFPISTPLWSAMAQTTPTITDMVSGNSLRKQAEAVNRNVTNWLSNTWWSKANIIASDFYLSNNVIDTAIYFNQIKGQLAKTKMGKFFFNKYQNN